MTTKAVVDDYVARLRALGTVRTKPMFGACGVYINEHFAAIIGEDRLFIKVKGLSDAQVETLFGNRNQPYEGAKNYAEADPADFDDAAWVADVQSSLRNAKVI